MKTKFILSSIFLSLSFASIVAENDVRTADLTKQPPSWTCVQSGKTVSHIAQTSYGFVVPNDGRIITAYSSNGNALWTKPLKGKPGNHISVSNDFIAYTTESKKLSLINPSGLILWTVNAGFEIKENPLFGRDFRIFIKGSDNISCYGMNSIRKWSLKTKNLSSLPLSQLDDGSLLVFLAQEKDSKTTAQRISVYGEILEEITFAGKIASVSTSNEGVILLFYNNSCGLCSVENGNATSKWVTTDIKNTNKHSQIISSKEKNYSTILCNSSSKGSVYFIDNRTGKIISSFATDISPSDCTQFQFSENGIFIADKKEATEYSSDSIQLWKAKLPSKSKWTHIFYTKENQLLLSMNNWVIDCHKMTQTIKEKNYSLKTGNQKYLKHATSNSEFDKAGIRTLNDEKMSLMAQDFKKGDYGKKEEQYLSDLYAEASNFLSFSTSQKKKTFEGKSFFEYNPVYTQNLIELLSITGTDNFTVFLASITSSDVNDILMIELIHACGINQYDPDGEMLLSFEQIIQQKLKKKDISIAKELCDSTFLICRFNGRPALYKRGKDILTYLLYPQFDKNIRDYARETLKKIVELEL